MKIPNSLLPVFRILCLAIIVFIPRIGLADIRTEELKRCLQDFGGIEWKLPYQPPMHIRSCASQTVSFDTGKTTIEGHRSLELIGELTLGRDTNNLSSDETYAALQNATFTHFDALFRRHGYRRIALEYGDARTRYDMNALSMLRGMNPVSKEAADEFNSKEAQKPPIPYIKLARFVRLIQDKEVTLICKTDARNTWSITIDGLPTVSASQGGTQ